MPGNFDIRYLSRFRRNLATADLRTWGLLEVRAVPDPSLGTNRACFAKEQSKRTAHPARLSAQARPGMLMELISRQGKCWNWSETHFRAPTPQPKMSARRRHVSVGVTTDTVALSDVVTLYRKRNLDHHKVWSRKNGVRSAAGTRFADQTSFVLFSRRGTRSAPLWAASAIGCPRWRSCA
eukprot:scaffold438_cov250-Pinguiococcus_pyrenoidosus.AAC.40